MDGEEYEFPFLQEVYTPCDAPKVDLVFVHGLNPRGRNDHPFETWTHSNGKFWPKDFLAEDIGYARVFVYGYNSNITNSQTMSTASIKDHANTLLNLLDMERIPSLHSMPPKVIFIGHSLGGLVIKQALLNANEDPKYNSIRVATSGLVFFGTPHRGAKAVELGKIAARVARFVSKGHASNDLLDCLEHNSMFTRQMSDRFRHQLEDYRVISFIEGKEVQIGGIGPASLSHLVVDEESAVLGLSGMRETQLKLDADHSQMCKVASRGPMYRLIKGNIKQMADQALIADQGYVPQSSPHPSTGRSPPPVPPRMHSNSSASYAPPGGGRPNEPTQRIVGSVFVAQDKDPRSIRSAELKNLARWEESRDIDYQIFQDHLRTLGADHLSTLSMGYNLAEMELEANYLSKATEWTTWVSDNSQRVFGTRHPLAMKTESLMAEILCAKGKYQEAESICANVLARQQMTIGEDHFDTLDTRRRLGAAYNGLHRRANALMTAEKIAETMKRLLGENHIRVFGAILDTLEWILYNHEDTTYVTVHLQPDVRQAVEMLPHVHEEIKASLDQTHPLTIRALSLVGRGYTRAEQTVEASETLRRALAICEETYGPDHPQTMDIVSSIGIMYAFQTPQQLLTARSRSEALPWLIRYLEWCERRRGLDNPETQIILEMLGNLHFATNEYAPAQKYYERALIAYGGANPAATQRISTNLQLCRANTMFTNRTGSGSDIRNFLSALKRF
ncbi:Tetratricopeptide-like helical [Penicillium malachiteum]|uniref:Tetratricopeptide-like helical n=1 Tax=Penicillium malachiteum TaxID=1324776 RepID=UPI002547856C|nr:Tetratricopeptide-like helical [Penicillium malachiteum]KAJ5730453.1 Tetratricopeptide-like helical [Penicillium malachiteum]